jgi:hypothetical protein
MVRGRVADVVSPDREGAFDEEPGVELGPQAVASRMDMRRRIEARAVIRSLRRSEKLAYETAGAP